MRSWPVNMIKVHIYCVHFITQWSCMVHHLDTRTIRKWCVSIKLERCFNQKEATSFTFFHILVIFVNNWLKFWLFLSKFGIIMFKVDCYSKHASWVCSRYFDCFVTRQFGSASIPQPLLHFTPKQATPWRL